MPQLLLADKIKTRGVLRPIEPEVYVPGNFENNLFESDCSVGHLLRP